MNKLFRVLLSRIEALQAGVIAYAYKEELWWTIAVNDYEIYCSAGFKTLKESWRKIFAKKGVKVIYVFQSPSEKILQNLLEHNSLIINV